MAFKEGQWLPGSKAGSNNPFQSKESILNNRTGWRREGGMLVQYKKGKKTGKTKKYATDTNLTGKTLNTIGRTVKKTVKFVNRKSKEAKERRKREGIGEYKKKPTTTKKSEDTSKKSDSLKAGKKELGKEEWLKKTRRSPAASAGFSDDERWAMQQKHREWKAKRKAGTHRKKRLTNAEKLKARTGR